MKLEHSNVLAFLIYINQCPYNKTYKQTYNNTHNYKYNFYYVHNYTYLPNCGIKLQIISIQKIRPLNFSDRIFSIDILILLGVEKYLTILKN